MQIDKIKIEKLYLVEDIKKMHIFMQEMIDEFIIGKVEDREDIMKAPKYFTNNGGVFLIAKDSEGYIIGTIALQNILINGKKSGFLKRFYVSSSFRGKGIGVKMMNIIEDFAKNNNYYEIVLGINRINKNICKFYEKHNYLKIIKNIPKEIYEENDEWYYRKLIN